MTLTFHIMTLNLITLKYEIIVRDFLKQQLFGSRPFIIPNIALANVSRVIELNSNTSMILQAYNLKVHNILHVSYVKTTALHS